MTTTYDKEYQHPDLFGEAYPELIEFFKNRIERGTLLDLGCGQGRDSVPLAKLGYAVTGVDTSKVGVEQMIEKAGGLNLRGEVADIHEFDLSKGYDIVLLDSMLHFDKKGKEKELSLLRKIADHAKVVCVCIWKNPKKERILNQFFDEHEAIWETLENTYLDYEYRDPGSDHRNPFQYYMLIKERTN